MRNAKHQEAAENNFIFSLAPTREEKTEAIGSTRLSLYYTRLAPPLLAFHSFIRRFIVHYSFELSYKYVYSIARVVVFSL